jgi:hypothetical protein
MRGRMHLKASRARTRAASCTRRGITAAWQRASAQDGGSGRRRIQWRSPASYRRGNGPMRSDNKNYRQQHVGDGHGHQAPARYCAGDAGHLVAAASAAVAFAGHRHVACRGHHHLDVHIRRPDALRHEPSDQRKRQPPDDNSANTVQAHASKISIGRIRSQGSISRISGRFRAFCTLSRPPCGSIDNSSQPMITTP